MLNDRIAELTAYPFTRLTKLLDGLTPPAGTPALNMALGEPQHAVPPFLAEVLARHADGWTAYPPLAGTPAWRAAACGWLERRYGAGGRLIDPDAGILPLSGTREGLFLAALLTVPQGRKGEAAARPAVLIPNPFYATYEGAAVMAGAEPVFLDANAAAGFLPDLDALEAAQARDGLLDRTALTYLCSPANPQGAIASRDYLARLLALARRHGFVLAVDECYAEIYDAAPPPGTLEAAAGMDGGALDNLLVFHSLSKRSSAAGLRSGFVAGDKRLITAFRLLRGYSAAGMPLPLQAASAALWDDDTHAADNRARYRAKIDAAEHALAGRFGFYRPPGGFFLWLEVGDGEAVARRLWVEAGVRVLPGAYLARPDADGTNPGRPFVRVALVHEPARIAAALADLRDAVGVPQPAAVGG